MSKGAKISRENVEDLYALSPMQEGILFHTIRDENGEAYFEQLSLQITGTINPVWLRRAWEWVIEHNEALRTVFAWDRLDQPVQIVLKTQELLIREHDLSELPEEERVSQCEALKVADRHAGFDLQRGPLFRVLLCKLENGIYELVISNHHIIYDGWSNSILLHEFFTTYGRLSRGEGLPSASKEKFKRYIHWLHQQDRTTHLHFWCDHLAGWETIGELPADQRGCNPVRSTSHYTYLLPPELECKVEQVARQQLVTSGALFYACWAIFLHKLYTISDLVYGTTVSGRPSDLPNVEQIVGLFINTVPLRIKLDEKERGSQFVQRIHQLLLQRQPYETTPLAEIKNCCDLPLTDKWFDTLLVLENYPLEQDPTGTIDGLTLRGYSMHEVTEYDLVLSITRFKETRFHFGYHAGLFSQETIGRWAGYLVQILKSISEKPGILIGELEILSVAEKEQLLREFNQPSTPYPREKTVPELFAEIVERWPDHTAVVFGEHQWSYRELDERSEALAILLRTKGVRPEKIVGIMAQRSLDAIQGILAIVRAGGAYMPIDPDIPQSRIEFMLHDSGAELLLVGGECEKISGLSGSEYYQNASNIHTHAKISFDKSSNEKSAGSEREVCANKMSTTDEPSNSINTGNMSTGMEFCINRGLYNKINFEGEILEIQDLYSVARTQTTNVTESHLTTLNTSFLSIPLTPQNLIYVIYTSGSTGTPKGVMIEQHSVVRLVKNSNMLIIKENDRILQTGSLAFDASTYEIWGALLNGATLYVITKDDLLSAEKFATKVREYGITQLWLTAPLFNQLLEEKPGFLTGVKRLYVGGDVLSPKHINEARTQHPGLMIINGYGPTENTTFTTYYQVEEDFSGPIPIGQPVSNTQVYIFDNIGRLQPLGVAGEVCIGGEGLARGYLNRPELTAEKFVSNPLLPGEQMYKSGDLARWLPDGTIDFFGRLDQQVKIRGFRIELGEIEQTLLKHLAIKEAVVLVHKMNGENNLTAYYVADGELSPDILREILRSELPDYMQPTYLFPLKAIPLTTNGKLDRRALPTPVIRQVKQEYLPPTDEVEEILCKIWGAILKVEQVGVMDHFFALGGHSLKALTLLSRVQKELHVGLSLQQIFQTPTICELAAVIRSVKCSQNAGMTSAPTFETLQPIPTIKEKNDYPVSPAQKRMYVASQMEPDCTHYNINGAFHIYGILDRKRLEQAFVQLIERHEILRTSFHLFAGEPIQHVWSNIGFAFSPIPDHPVDFIKPFDLSKVPLIRVGLQNVAPEEYLLILDLHHIIADGLSMEILIRDVLEFYCGKKPETLRIQYKDYAEWQNRQLHSAQYQTIEAYWVNQFAGELPVLDLVTDFPRPAVMEFSGTRETCSFDQRLTGGLQKLAEETQTTLYIVVLTLVHVFLHKYTGQEDVIVGSPVAGRSHPNLEPLIGMFVNTLPLRSYPEGEKTFTQFIAEVKAIVLQGFEHQAFPLETLMEQLALQRDLSRNPLFDVIFSWQNFDWEHLTLPGFTIQQCKLENPCAKFDLTLLADLQEDRIIFEWEYRTHLFDHETIKQMIRHFAQLARAVVENPTEKLARLEMISPEERKLLLEPENVTPIAYIPEKTIHQWFAEQVASNPDIPALVYGDEQLTYQELSWLAGELAHELRRLGVGPEKIVGILAEPSLEMVFGVWAVLQAGGAYLPIDPNYPAERIQYMLIDSGAQVLLGQASLSTKVAFTANWLTLPGIQERQSALARFKQNGTNPSPKTDSNLSRAIDEYFLCDSCAKNLAYVIYTSGSTGQPKGVLIEHQTLVNTVNWYVRHFGFREGERCTQYAGFGFDASVSEIFPTLVSGATLYIIPQEMKLHLPELHRYFLHHKITIAFLPTQVCEQFMELECPDLRILHTGGDQLRKSVPTSFELHNNYGPTESTIVATTFRVQGEYAKIPIGRPVDHTWIYLLSPEGQLQPLGVPGELCIGGERLARGYLNQPTLTAEKFIPDPYRARGRMYRTGDRARWRTDGTLEFLGRFDHQVKIRGFRIELGEIEHQLLTLPEISEVAVLVCETKIGDKYLVAYIVNTEPIKTEELRQKLTKSLPDYMIPAQFIMLQHLPLTANGKLNRQALPEPSEHRYSATHQKKPQTELEQTVVNVWSQVLGVKELGVEDHFFEKGGHSLHAMQAITLLHRECHAMVTIKEIFQNPTARSLAKVIEGKMEQSYQMIPPLPEQNAYELSFAQMRLWYLYQMDPENVAYNMPGQIDLYESIEPVMVEKALWQLIQRHESLRTRFVLQNGKPVQQILPVDSDELNFSLKCVDLALHHNESRKPFHLDQAPLLRAILAKHAPAKYELYVVMHHIISDGWSMGILRREFEQIYSAQKTGEKPNLPDLPIQYKDFAAWQNQLLNAGDHTKVKTYWREQLSGEEQIMHLPVDYPASTREDRRSAAYRIVLTSEVSDSLRKIARECGASLFMVLFTGFHIFLSRLTGQQELLIGIPAAGRIHESLYTVIGFFINTLIIKNEIHPEERFTDALQQIQVNTLLALEYQSYPLELVIEELQLKYPQIPVFFNMLNIQELVQESLQNLEPSHIEVVQDNKFDLTWYVVDHPNGIEISCHYLQCLFTPKTVEQMMGLYQRLLQDIANDPGKMVKEYGQTTKKRKLF